MEVPHEAIASAREAAANAIVIEDDDMEDEPQPEGGTNNDVTMEGDDNHTVAEPEGELDLDMDLEEDVWLKEQMKHIFRKFTLAHQCYCMTRSSTLTRNKLTIDWDWW